MVEDSTARQLLANMAYTIYTGSYMWYATRAFYRSVLSSSTLTASPELRMVPKLIRA